MSPFLFLTHTCNHTHTHTYTHTHTQERNCPQNDSLAQQMLGQNAAIKEVTVTAWSATTSMSWIRPTGPSSSAGRHAGHHAALHRKLYTSTAPLSTPQSHPLETKCSCQTAVAPLHVRILNYAPNYGIPKFLHALSTEKTSELSHTHAHTHTHTHTHTNMHKQNCNKTKASTERRSSDCLTWISFSREPPLFSGDSAGCPVLDGGGGRKFISVIGGPRSDDMIPKHKHTAVWPGQNSPAGAVSKKQM